MSNKRSKKQKMQFLHFRVLVSRYFHLILSDRLSAALMVLQAPIMLVIISLVCPYDSFTNLNEPWASDTAMFVVVSICAIMGLMNSYREVSKEREIFERESNAGLQANIYLLSKSFVLGTVCFLQSLVLTVGMFLVMSIPVPTPILSELMVFLVVFLTMFSSCCMGLFVSCLLKNSDSAVMPVLMLIIMQVVFSGGVIDLSGSTELISFAVVSRWGLSAFGNIIGRNAMYEGILQKPLYDVGGTFSLLIMVAICFLFTLLSIIVLEKSQKIK